MKILAEWASEGNPNKVGVDGNHNRYLDGIYVSI